ncbi:glycosyltransferase family 2 protein [Acidocella aminolytica]|jgi:GT2 family glycosyltransferase|uniref:O-antigen biosynthesis protein RfbC n=1 Tax=Acidocella aminolytica 101 = DSM 11237 TaxID=1120923 RepID=A0A0D6PJK6_9PROT|nr:glycosyltransferase family 2 protein [Acidocella aminolytica]GAN81363.1 O-antigen biosynthesis protein RfbC [Acidocella aminolytica 101 = DSM 11237]GBQ33589.1 putative glycosyltransferase [Acidocella aminolytica 101 = DSM 11237]SHF43024.1 Glycosyltransferase, GT2 family [Acidocella aminolytica 101 = DSM 11237]
MARKTVNKVPVVKPERKLLCFLDQSGGEEIGGWAMDFDSPAESLKMRVVIDGVIEEVMTCDLHREDSRLMNLENSRIGFRYRIPDRYKDGMRHALRFATLDGALVPIGSRSGMALEEYNFVLEKPARLMAVVDGMVDGLIQGWVLRVDDEAGTKLGGVRVLVTHDGQPVAELLADQFRADVVEAVDGDPACGFAFALPPELRRREQITLKFFAMPEREELRGSPLEISFPGDSAREKIETLIKRTDELFSFAYHLKKELKAAIPRERYLLADYQRWALDARPLVLPRAKARYGVADVATAKVSIICPVYRPAAGDFLAAVESVRAQTHENWELLLVDDASGDRTLTALMKDLAAMEPRMRLISRRKNGGIARATNDGLKAAKGAFIVFFDHDDMLEPCALEVMLLAQAATGAKLLYSDEDKVERGGTVSEPHFKPDFNYRFLLDINYICHLTMVEAAALRAAGGLDPELDGAQDHDLLLRLTESLAPEQIHHVAEILYHWRKTASSTAAAGTGAKPKAALAGAEAVQAHLARRGLPAKVVPRGSLTCYKVDWKFPVARVKKAGVSILIPYRDHVDMTRDCVEAIRAHTKGVNYEIILLDNWSTTPEAVRFAAEQANIEGTKVLRIAEPFNYSRINNLGVREARQEFLLFMNNDVFVDESGWLRRLLDEALAEENVGAVGAKLLYPDGTVQHAGVVLGVGGVADHAFRGLDGDAPGYMAHAMAAQEVSAVTAACMLVRKTAFDMVGGFDERELSIAFNDVDLCVKLRQAGMKVIFMPDVVAEHRESISRGDDFDHGKLARFMFENEVMRQRYEVALPNDPYYNQHFSREGGVYRDLRMVRPGES